MTDSHFQATKNSIEVRRLRGMKKLAVMGIVILFGISVAVSAAAGEGVGNPRPGFPHDTIIFHVQKGENGPKNCDGGHSLFLRHVGGVIIDTLIHITMVDWNQVDNDNDGKFDEDPIDGIDNDGDGLFDEDGLEPGAVTTALDCDGLDGEISLQIRDTNPIKGVVSTQEWFMRMIGKPEENFAFTTFANQTVTCTVLDDPDGIPNSGDEVVECVSGDQADWVQLASFNLANDGCVKQVKLGGKNTGKGGGKTPFCDITEGFLVDVDTDGDGIIDSENDFIFSISCADNPDTLDVDESLFCPLSSLIWDIDETATTLKATAQVFVGHTGAASVKSGKIKKGKQ